MSAQMVPLAYHSFPRFVPSSIVALLRTSPEGSRSGAREGFGDTAGSNKSNNTTKKKNPSFVKLKSWGRKIYIPARGQNE